MHHFSVVGRSRSKDHLPQGQHLVVPFPDAVIQCSRLKTGTLNFVNFFSGPVASLLIEKYSTRVTMFIGGILSALGLVISAFAGDFFVILLSFGIITGKFNYF